MKEPTKMTADQAHELAACFNTLCATYPDDQCDVWVRHDAGKMSYIAVVGAWDNDQVISLLFPNPGEAVSALVKEAGLRDRASRKEKLMAELRAKIAKLEST